MLVCPELYDLYAVDIVVYCVKWCSCTALINLVIVSFANVEYISLCVYTCFKYVNAFVLFGNKVNR